jgi:hypothetical protein
MHWYWLEDLQVLQQSVTAQGFPPEHAAYAVLRYQPTGQYVNNPNPRYGRGEIWVYTSPDSPAAEIATTTPEAAQRSASSELAISSARLSLSAASRPQPAVDHVPGLAASPWHGNPIRDPGQIAVDDILVFEDDGIRWRVAGVPAGGAGRGGLIEVEPVDNPGGRRQPTRHATRQFAVHRDGTRLWSRVPPARIGWSSAQWHEQVVLPVHHVRHSGS